jgi:flagellar export protein FliJ
MKRFRFSLQSLQTLRQQQEQKALECYGQAVRYRESAARALSQAESRQARARTEWCVQATHGCAAAQMNHWQRYTEELERQSQACRISLVKAEQETTRLHKAFLAARQAREIVDKFHDHRWHDHQQEQRKEEQQMLDEIGLVSRGLDHPSLTT